MRSITVLLVLLLSVIAGCQSRSPASEATGAARTSQTVMRDVAAGSAERYAPRLLVEGHPARPWTYEFDAGDARGSRTWYSAADLDRISREYVRAENIDFSFKGTEPQFWVARDREYMARGTYSSGIGKPFLDLKIGWDGYVKKHTTGFAIGATGAGEHGPFLSPRSLPATVATTLPPNSASPRSLAGDYSTGVGLMITFLSLRENGTFSARLRGCLAEYGKASGVWSRSGERVTFSNRESTGILENYLGGAAVVDAGEDPALVLDQWQDLYKKYGVQQGFALQRIDALDD